MNLFEYTKKLSDKIRFYDSIAQTSFSHIVNPFAKPINLTIVWVEDDCENR